MLGFDDEVERREAAVRRVIRQHDQFAGARRRADVDQVRAQALGRTHPGAAGADDLCAFRDCLRAIGNGRDALGTAGLEDLRDAGHASRDEGCIIEASVRTGRRDDADLLHARHLGRDRLHEHRGRKRPLAARDIAGHRGDGVGAVAREDAGADFVKPHLLRLLVLVEAADVDGHVFQRVLHVRVQRLLGAGEVGFRRGQRIGLDGRLVKLAGEACHRFVALVLDGEDDGLRLLLEVGEVGLAALQQLVARGARHLREIVEGDWLLRSEIED